MAITLKTVLKKTILIFFGKILSLVIYAKNKTAKDAIKDLEKWNWPTLTWFEIKMIKLSANPKINTPMHKNKPLFAKGDKLNILNIYNFKYHQFQ